MASSNCNQHLLCSSREITYSTIHVCLWCLRLRSNNSGTIPDLGSCIHALEVLPLLSNSLSFPFCLWFYLIIFPLSSTFCSGSSCTSSLIIILKRSVLLLHLSPSSHSPPIPLFMGQQTLEVLFSNYL